VTVPREPRPSGGVSESGPGQLSLTQSSLAVHVFMFDDPNCPLPCFMCKLLAHSFSAVDHGLAFMSLAYVSYVVSNIDW